MLFFLGGRCQGYFILSNTTSFEPRHDKTNKVNGRPAKTQISLGIRPVWSESSLSAWRHLGSLPTHWAHSEHSYQTLRVPRLIWVFAGHTLTLLVLSCRGLICLCEVIFHYLLSNNKWAASWQNLFIPYTNNKDKDQPAHPHCDQHLCFSLPR